MLTTTVERLEGTNVKLTVTVPAEDVDASIAECIWRASAPRCASPASARARRRVRSSTTTSAATTCLPRRPRVSSTTGIRARSMPRSCAPSSRLSSTTLDTVWSRARTTRSRSRSRFGPSSSSSPTRAFPSRCLAARSSTLTSTRSSTRSASVSRRSSRSRTAGVSADDFVLLSFVGYVDGETYEGNVVDKYLYEMGRGLMPVEFDEGLLGLEPGAETRIEFAIPDTSSKTEYVGKTAQFDVTIHEIKAKKLPEVDDDLRCRDGLRDRRADARGHAQPPRPAASARLQPCQGEGRARGAGRRARRARSPRP